MFHPSPPILILPRSLDGSFTLGHVTAPSPAPIFTTTTASFRSVIGSHNTGYSLIGQHMGVSSGTLAFAYTLPPFRSVTGFSPVSYRPCWSHLRLVNGRVKMGISLKTGWLDYFITGLETQMIEVKKRGEQVIRRDVLVRKHGLNERQDKSIEFLFEHGKLTIQDFERLCPDVNRRSLQRDLKGVLEKGLIKEVGAGPTDPTRHYILSEL
jgi:hypothetical protein